MSAKHTGGTWRAAAKPSSIVGWPIISSPQGKSVANVHGTDEESAANARLIAAAPDLLTALQDAYRFISQPRTMWNDKAEYDTRNYNALTAKIRAAISKAEGSAK